MDFLMTIFIANKEKPKSECAIELVRCDQISKNLRSRKLASVQEEESAQEKPTVPAKRSRRLFSAPQRSTNKEPDPPTETVSAKRGRRLQSATQKSDNKKADSPSDEDTISKVVTMICKLTNELLLAKKQLSDKSDFVLKLQQSYFEKNIECNKAQAVIEEKNKKIEELQNTIEVMRAEKYCDDLIKFEENSGKTSGKFSQYLKMKLVHHMQ